MYCEWLLRSVVVPFLYHILTKILSGNHCVIIVLVHCSCGDVGCDAFKIFCSGHYVCRTVSNTWIIGCLVVLRSLFVLDVECSPSLRILCSDDYVCGTVSNTGIIGCPVVFRSLFTLNVECPAAFTEGFRISFLVITSVLPSAIL